MTFLTRNVTRFGRPMVMLSVSRAGGPLPVGYFLASDIPQAKINFSNQVAQLSR